MKKKEYRTIRITVRLSPTEYKKIKENAQYIAVSPSTYLRQCGVIIANADLKKSLAISNLLMP